MTKLHPLISYPISLLPSDMLRLLRTVVWFPAIMAGMCVHAQQWPAPLLPVVVDGKWGFIDTSGAVVVPPRYDYASDLSGNIFSVVSEAGRYGVINKRGEEVIACREDSIIMLTDSLFAVLRGHCWALMDWRGNMLSGFLFTGLQKTQGNIIRCTTVNGAGLMDFSGRMILSPVYEDFYFRDSLILTVLGGQFGLCSYGGRKYLDPEYDEIQRMNRKVAMFEKDGKMGFVSLSSGLIHKAQWEGLQIMDPVRGHEQGSYGFSPWVLTIRGQGMGLYHADIDSAILSPDKEAIFPAGIRGFFAFTRDGHTGLAAADGRLVLSPEYDRLEGMAGMYLLVFVKEKMGLADTSGRFIADIIHKDIRYIQQDNEGRSLFACSSHGRKFGLLRSDSVWLTEQSYADIFPVNSRVLAFKEGQKYGVMSEQGIELHAAGFDLIKPAVDNVHSIFSGTLAGLMNANGRVLALPRYSKIVEADNVYKLYKGRGLTILWLNEKKEMTDSVFYDDVPSVHVKAAGNARVIEWTADSRAEVETPLFYRFYYSPDTAMWGVKDGRGTGTVQQPQFDNYRIIDDETGRFALVFVKTDSVPVSFGECNFYSRSLCGLYDLKYGRLLLKPVYLHISVLSGERSSWAARFITAEGDFGYISSRELKCCKGFTYTAPARGQTSRVNIGGKLAVLEYKDENMVAVFDDFIAGFTCKLRAADPETRSIIREGNAYLSCRGGHWGKLHYFGNYRNVTGEYQWMSDGTGDIYICSTNGKRNLVTNRGFVSIQGVDYEKYLDRRSFTTYFEISKPKPLFGYMKPDGNLLTDIEYEAALNFSEGYAAVKTGNKWGYIDHTGRLVIPAVFAQAGSFSGGLAAVKQGRKWGYADKSGVVVINCDYTRVGDFSEGKAWVRRAGKYYYIDTYGEVVFEQAMKKCGSFNGGYAVVTVSSGAGIMDAEGKFVIPPRYDRIPYYDPEHNHAIVYRRGRFTVAGLNGKRQRSARFCDFQRPQSGLIAVRIDNKWGFVNYEGKIVIPCKYEAVKSFSCGLAAVMLDYRWGAIDQKGKMVIANQYLSLSDFNEGLAIAMTGRYKAMLVDTAGNIVRRELNIKAVSGHKDGRAIVVNQLGGKKFLGRDGDYTCRNSYINVFPFDGTLARAQNSDGWGLLDTSERWIIQPRYDSIREFHEGIAVVNIRALRGIADIYGRILLEPDYQSVQYVCPNIVRLRKNNAIGYANLQGRIIWPPAK